MKEKEFLDDIMGFDPSNLSAFQENTSSAEADPQVYKTNPVTLSKTEDGHYHAVVRVLYNPFNVKESVIKQVLYRMQDENGYFSANSSLAVGDKKCPLFSAWKKLHFAKTTDGQEDTVRKNWGDSMYTKREARWVMVQIIEDENQPELVGQFKAWKLPKAVWAKMEAKMHPSPDSKKTPVALMDYLFGPCLTIDVAPGPEDKDHPERRQREISYDLCEFESDPHPIISMEGEALFNEEEMELIENYYDAKQTILKESAKAKTKVTEKKIAEANEVVKNLTEDVKKLYLKAIEYMKQNSFNIFEKFGYKQWDSELAARVQNWINKVAIMQDPAAITFGAPAKAAAPAVEETIESDPFEDAMGESEDMPF